MSTINWRQVYNITSFALVILITIWAAIETGALIRQYGMHAINSLWLHPLLALFSALITVWFVQTNPWTSLISTSSAVLNALLIEGGSHV